MYLMYVNIQKQQKEKINFFKPQEFLEQGKRPAKAKCFIFLEKLKGQS